MIVRPAPGGGTLFLRQVDHAALCGPWARAWRWRLPLREETAQAAALHDNGWMEWDERPTVGPDGRPHDYRTIPDEAYREVWARGFARAWDRSPWIGSLVSRHGCAFLRGREDFATQRLVAEEERRQRRADASEEAESAAAVIRWLDGLSLFLCEEWASPWRGSPPQAEITATRTLDEVRLDPWPFQTEHLEAEVAAVRVDAERWESDADLISDLDGGKRVTLRWRLLPGV